MNIENSWDSKSAMLLMTVAFTHRNMYKCTIVWYPIRSFSELYSIRTRIKIAEYWTVEADWKKDIAIASILNNLHLILFDIVFPQLDREPFDDWVASVFVKCFYVNKGFVFISCLRYFFGLIGQWCASFAISRAIQLQSGDHQRVLSGGSLNCILGNHVCCSVQTYTLFCICFLF